MRRERGTSGEVVQLLEEGKTSAKIFHLFPSYCIGSILKETHAYIAVVLLGSSCPLSFGYHSCYVPLPPSFSSLSVSSRACLCKLTGRGILGQLRRQKISLGLFLYFHSTVPVLKQVLRGLFSFFFALQYKKKKIRS